ncbi:sigma factor [Nonomuraea sp. AD125B]|uniref:sigma factor n=1 Tax=Nonomuraea sp. AD125B TaxID=3242897 RepID=UPI003528A5E5
MADLTAEIFLAALHSRHTYRLGRGSEAGWLYGVARNVPLAQRRRGEREARAVERIVARRLLDGDDIADLTDRIDAEEPARRALSAMADLPEGERRCWNSWSSTREPRPACRPARRLVAVAGLAVAVAAVVAFAVKNPADAAQTAGRPRLLDRPEGLRAGRDARRGHALRQR